MRFDHKEAENQLLIEGEADFQVLRATDEVSKSSGNEMIKLQIKVWDLEGRTGIIFDYLLPKLAWKIKHFCDSVGIPEDKFKSNELSAADCEGKKGKAVIKTQKDKTGQYPDKSAIADYIAANSERPAIQSSTAANEFKDDDLPF